MNRTSGLPDLIVQHVYILYLHTKTYIYVNILNISNLNMMGFFSFFTGNQRDNCPIKYISKNVEMSVFIMGGNVLILTRVEMS